MTTENTSAADEKKPRRRSKTKAAENNSATEIPASGSSEKEKSAAKKPPVGFEKTPDEHAGRTEQPKKKNGRPSIFSDAIADEICVRISQGQSLRRICFDDHMPDQTTVYDWLIKNGGFSHKYARARENQAETLFDEALDIAREHEDPAKARVVIDTFKWAAGKLKPKKYGDKIEHTVQQDFVPLDELRRRIEESKARRAALEAGETITIEASKVVEGETGA
jgi:hypothetical protein